MFWLSRMVLKLDAEGKAALRQAAFEENVRLALWRMDSALSNFISLENARPYDSYPSLIRNLPSMPDTTAAASPVQIKLYFQFEPDGRLVLPETAEIKNAQMDQLRSKVTRSELLKSVQYTKDIQTLQKRLLPPKPEEKNRRVEKETRTASPDRELLQEDSSVSDSIPDDTLSLKSRFRDKGQQRLNIQELNTRNDLIVSNDVLALNQLQQQLPSRSGNIPSDSESFKEPMQDNPSPTKYAESSARTEWVKKSVPQDTNLELIHPVWLGKDLFLVRRVLIDRQEYVQGCWLDWEATRRMLLERIRDLLPDADLIEKLQPAETEQTRMLASIPVLLDPGPLPPDPDNGWSVLYTSLGIAWLGVLLATLAVGIVLWRTLELNRRRGAFVSAVTHELRTPLTTFRLYTEMLDEGMVPDAEKQKRYLGTLRGEAERLDHLVENVLAYSQLENNRGGAERIETVGLKELRERIAPRLAERAGQLDMDLIQKTANAAENVSVRADFSAVERILFNLTDNAGKYARDAKNRSIEFAVRLNNRTAALSIRDYGPGIPEKIRGKLFLPFSKSANEAADSAPGVGLGLAISRRLARQMKGDLFYDSSVTDGTRFVLTLPLA